MRHKETVIQAIKFTLFSISAGVIQILSFALLYDLFKWDYWVSYLIALTLSVLWNFTFNRKFTFKSAANVPIAMVKVFAFYLVFTPLSTWGGDALEKIGWPAYLVVSLSMLLNFVTEFLYTKYFVFKNQINTAGNNDKQTATH